MDFANEISYINTGLASKGIKLRLEKRGGVINVRGPLPSKETRDILKIQRISLKLPANLEGLRESEKLIELLLLQLRHDQFHWEDWKKENPEKKETIYKDVSEYINKFESVFFSSQNQSNVKSSKKTTWNYSYKPYLNRLKKLSETEGQTLNINLLCKTLESYKSNTRSRQQCSLALSVFARYLKIELPENWKKIGSGYGIKKYNFRKLPNDSQIKEIWDLIPNNQWKLVYGIMATYGLRNHEVFFSDFSSLCLQGDHIIRVLPNTKTGEHQVWPFHPEWVSYFELSELAQNKDLLPKINLDLNSTTLQHVGRRVSEQFRRYDLPLTPYDLRHAWAIRTIHIGLPDTVSARMMGHSVSIHNKTYQHWITKRDQQQAVDNALARYQN